MRIFCPLQMETRWTVTLGVIVLKGDLLAPSEALSSLAQGFIKCRSALIHSAFRTSLSLSQPSRNSHSLTRALVPLTACKWVLLWTFPSSASAPTVTSEGDGANIRFKLQSQFIHWQWRGKNHIRILLCPMYVKPFHNKSPPRPGSVSCLVDL